MAMPTSPRLTRRLHRRLVLPVLLCGSAAATPAFGEPIGTLAELREAGGTPIEVPQLHELLSGSRITTFVTRDPGIDRSWTNHPDGRFLASWRRTGIVSIGGHGEWRIESRGGQSLYCVRIDWQPSGARRPWQEQWCATLYRLGDEHFGVRERLAGDDPAQAVMPIEIRPRAAAGRPTTAP